MRDEYDDAYQRDEYFGQDPDESPLDADAPTEGQGAEHPLDEDGALMSVCPEDIPNGNASPRQADDPRAAIPPKLAPQVNGHLNGAPKGNGHVAVPYPDISIEAWRKSLMGTAFQLLLSPGHGYDKAIPARNLLEPLTDDMLRFGVDVLRGMGTHPPRDLTESDIREECERTARDAIEGWLGTSIWSKPRNLDEALPAIELNGADYADRQAIDAFMAYEAMKGDSREYSWDGLIREGCTAVLSGLMSSGKTTLGMNIARGWALGTKVLDRQCKQSRTLVVVSPKEYEAWAETVGFWKIKGQIFLIESTKAHFPERTEHVKWFDYTMQKNGCRTFVLDTLFDFFGMPPNTAGDSNRIAMNEQTPLLQMVRERGYSGLVTGHAPKSEARAIDPRDPEEAFGGHTAWTAQHRMRMTVRRKSQGINAFITGRGGYGDTGILKEQMLLFDETTRLDSLAGLFAEHLGKAALPSVLEALKALGTSVALSKLVREMDKGEKWIRPGLKEGQKQGLIEKEGKGRATRYRAIEGIEGGLFNRKVWGDEDEELDVNGIPKGW